MECGVANGHVPTVLCTLEAGHSGDHRHNRGPFWSSPTRHGQCPYFGPLGTRCALPVDHWHAHWDDDGNQFTESQAVLP